MCETVIKGKFLHAYHKVYDFDGQDGKHVHIDRFYLVLIDDDAFGDPYITFSTDFETGKKLGLNSEETIKAWLGRFVTLNGILTTKNDKLSFQIQSIK